VLRVRRARALLTFAAVAAALALGVAVLVPPGTQRVPALDADSRTVRGSLHVHTNRSDGTGTVDDVAEAARRAGLQFVILTDHGDGTRVPAPPVYRGGVLVIDAVEISTTGGHYVALGLGRAPYRLAGEPRDVVDDVTRLGGFGIVAHPDSPKEELRWRDWSLPFEGIEWLNADSEWRNEGTVGVARALVTYWLRGPETITAGFDRPDTPFAEWDALSQYRRVIGVAGHDAHAVFRQTEELGEQMARQVRDLRARPEGELALRRIPVRDAGASLERRRALAIRPERALDDGGRAPQRTLHVAVLEAAREEPVAAHAVVHGRRAVARRGQDVDRRRSRIVVHADAGSGVLDEIAVDADDGNQRFSDVARRRPRQDRLLRLDVAGERRPRPHPMARHLWVGTRQDAHDAGRGGGGRRVDGPKARVGVHAAHERHVKQSRQLDVAGIATASR